MIVKLLTEHHLWCLSLKGGCRGSSESTLVKMPHCWKPLAVFLQGQNFLGVIDDPLFENLGVIGKFRGSELF